jgi:MFS family permease
LSNARVEIPHSFSAIFSLGIGTALSLMGDATLYAVLPTHPGDAGIALASVGVILSVNRIIRLVTNGPAGWLYDRVRDRRVIFLASLALGVMSTLLYALSPDFASFFFARLLWGAAWSGIWVGGNAIVLEMAPEGERGRWVGIYQVWFFFGSSLGSLFGGVLTDAFGYRPTLWIGAIISALGAIIAAIGLLNHFHLRDKKPASQPYTPKPRWSIVPDLRALSPRLWAVIAAHGVNRLVVAGVVTSTLGLLIQNLRGDAFGVASLTGGLLAARTLISLASAGIFGEWSDRIGSRWGLLALSLAMGAVGIFVFAIPDWFAFLLGAFVGALASGSIQSLATALIGDLSAATERGRHLGIFNTAGDLGSAIGPLAAFALLPITGLDAVFVVCAALMVGNAVWVLFVKRSEHAHVRLDARD